MSGCCNLRSAPRIRDSTALAPPLTGYPSGEAFKVGKADPYFLVQRGFLRQTVNLGGETEKLKPDLNQLGGTQTATPKGVAEPEPLIDLGVDPDFGVRPGPDIPAHNVASIVSSMIRTKVLTAILTGVSLVSAAASAHDGDFACPMPHLPRLKLISHAVRSASRRI